MAIPNYQNKMSAPDTRGLDVMRLSNVMDAMQQSQKIAQQTQQNVREAEKHTIDARSEIMKLPLEVDKLKREIRKQGIENEKAFALMPYEIELKKQKAMQERIASNDAMYDLEVKTLQSKRNSEVLKAAKIEKNDQLLYTAQQNDWEGQLDRALEDMSFAEITAIDKWINEASKIYGDDTGIPEKVKQYRQAKRSFLESQLYKAPTDRTLTPAELEAEESRYYATQSANAKTPEAKAFYDGNYANVQTARDNRIQHEELEAKDNFVRARVAEGFSQNVAERMYEQRDRAAKFGLNAQEMVQILGHIESENNLAIMDFDEAWNSEYFDRYRDNIELKRYVKNEFEIMKSQQAIANIRDEKLIMENIDLSNTEQSIQSSSASIFIKGNLNSAIFQPVDPNLNFDWVDQKIGLESIFSIQKARQKALDASPFGKPIVHAYKLQIQQLRAQMRVAPSKEVAQALSLAVTDLHYLTGETVINDEDFADLLQRHNIGPFKLPFNNPTKRVRKIMDVVGDHIRGTRGIAQKKDTVGFTYDQRDKLAEIFAEPYMDDAGKQSFFQMNAAGIKAYNDKLDAILSHHARRVDDHIDNRVNVMPINNFNESTTNQQEGNDLKDPTE
jgi:hypothetical protein